MMLYTVLQTSLVPPDMEKLRRALLNVPGMVAYDAEVILRDAFGILLRKQPLEKAAAFQSALAAQGIETEMVDERTLPELPAAKFVRRVEITPAALMIYDPIGRKLPVEWGHVHLVAAGMVRVTEFTQKKQMVRPAQVRRGFAGIHQEMPPEFETVTREARADKLLLELILARGAARLSFEVDHRSALLFSCLGERKTGEDSRNFALLVQDILQHAPKATLNRGADYLRDKGDQIFYYPSKNAFFEETEWLLWQMNRPA